jgi:UDP-glucose 4-epimerase
MYNNQTKILITGGAGFIGTNFINDLLRRGHNPDCIAVIDNLSHGTYLPNIHNNITFYESDCRDRTKVFEIFKNHKPLYVFMFHGLVSIYDCHRDPYEAVDNNILGSINILDAAAEAKVKRVIFSETSAVYENCEMPESGFNETQSDPTTIYSTTKACLALIAESYSRTKGVNYTALRYFNVFGKLQDWERTVPPASCGFAIRLMNRANPIIFGNGNRLRDFIHVDDVNAFHMLCMENEATANQTFNLGTGISTSLYSMIKTIADILGVSSYNISYLPEINGEAFDIRADISKAKSIGWSPKISFKEGHKDLIMYLKDLYNKGYFPKNYMDDININDVTISSGKN